MRGHRVDVITRWEILAYSSRLPPGRGYVLRLHDESGRIGLGEARALDGFASGPTTLESFLSRPDAVAALLDNPEADSNVPIEAVFAAETALADLAAQTQGVSLVEHLGCACPRALSNSLLVGNRGEALQLLSEGHRNFKLKAQGAAKDTMDLLCLLFDASDGTTNIRIDANGTWDRATAENFLNQAPRGSVSFIEQPFPPGDLDSCLWLRDLLPVPIALDEGVVSVEDVAAAARRGAAQVIVIKPMYRGLHGALRLAAAAADHSLGVCVTHAMDGTVGRLATMHVAAAADSMCPNSEWPHGLFAPDLTVLADEPMLQPDRLLMPAGNGIACHGLRSDQLERVCAAP
jgi:L-alanine-DL-glutamate epimerase-like enolase superfamily enzyme